MEAITMMTGNLGTDVDFRGEKEDGRVANASFRLACTPRRVGRDGEWVDGQTTWMTVSCFKQLAENVASSFRKGEPVMVIGKLRTNSWVDKETGEVRERLELQAKTVGHDLSRGTAAFKKKSRQQEQSDRVEVISDFADDVDESGADESGADEPQQAGEEGFREVAAA